MRDERHRQEREGPGKKREDPTGHGSDEGGELVLIISQLNHQESPESRVERRTTSCVQVAVGYTQEWEMFGLERERESKPQTIVKINSDGACKYQYCMCWTLNSIL